VSTANPKAVEAIAQKHAVDCITVGVTIEKGLEIRQRSVTLGSWEVTALKAAYEGAFESYVR